MAKSNSPAAWVVTVRLTPVAGLVMVTAVPGITTPEESVTLPKTSPDDCCPQAILRPNPATMRRAAMLEIRNASLIRWTAECMFMVPFSISDYGHNSSGLLCCICELTTATPGMIHAQSTFCQEIPAGRFTYRKAEGSSAE